MSQQSTTQTVHRSITLDVDVDRAFSVFTDEIGRWWPVENTFANVALGQPSLLETVVLEHRSGGRWFERTLDGEEITWGEVVAFESPNRLVLTWQITPAGQPEPDPTRASEVEIRFIPEDPRTTRVDIDHRRFERHGSDGAAVWQNAMESHEGWSKILDRFAIASTPDRT